jgi:gamma-glutamyltranspeptidase / glutathione hydrolase
VLPAAHATCLAMLAPVMTMNEGAAIYAPGGTLLHAGATVHQPGMAEALEALSADGADSVYSGTIAERLLELMVERGGLVTREDLLSYEARWSPPVEAEYRGCRFLTRGDLSGLPETLPRVPRLGQLDAAERVVALVETLAGDDVRSDTTNLVVADGEGNACVLTTSLGLGSGDWLPGFALHLNSMLGEADLLRGRLEPGTRMHSMMAPSLALEEGGRPVLAAGAAGGTRLRTALVSVVAGVLDEGLAADEAIARPRFHPAGRTVHAEPAVDEGGLARLETRGWSVRRWPAPHHYFGGVSAITPTAAAGDPRRSGSASLLG